MHRPLLYFNYEKINRDMIVLWYKGSKTFKGSLFYINKNKEPDLYNAILSIANNNGDSNRLMYLRVINDYIDVLKDGDEEYNKMTIDMLTLFNDLNYRIKLRDRT